MTGFVSGGVRAYIDSLRSAHRERISVLQQQLNQATTEQFKADVLDEMENEKRKLRQSIAAANRSLY